MNLYKISLEPLAFLILFFSSLVSFGQTSYVVSSNNRTFSVHDDFNNQLLFSSQDAARSLQWAIDKIWGNSSVGGDILIKEGNYPLNKFLFLRSNIWLHGQGKLTKLIVNANLRTCISLVDVTHTTLSDFSLIRNIKLGKEAISIERSVSCKVKNLFISGFETGIVNDDGSALTLITDNELVNNKLHIHIKSGGGVMGRWIPLFVTNNSISEGETGIHCNAMVTNILHNKIKNLSGRGIFASTNSIVVRGNEIENVDGDYAIFGTGAEFNCTDNSIKNVKGGGIRTRTRWGNFTNNRIINFGTVENPAIGILIVNDDTHEGPAESKVVYQNTIINEPGTPAMLYGIKEDGFTNVIINNTIQNYQDKAIFSIGKNTIVKENFITPIKE